MISRRMMFAALIGPALLETGVFAIRPAYAAQGLALVMNSGEASLSVLDMTSLTEVKRIPVLREPHHVVLAPGGQELLVGDTGGNEMLFLDPQTFEIRRRVACADPYQLGFSPDAKYLVVNGLARNQVDVYEAGSMKLVKRFPLSAMPSHVAFSPDGSMAFVSLQETGKLAAIDLRRMVVVWIAPVGSDPAGVLYNQDRVLVANMGMDNVAVVDPVDGHVERRVVTGKGAHQLFFSPDGRLIYVNNRVEGSTSVLDAATLAIVRSYKVPGGPDDIAFAPDGKLWITLRFARKVAVLDPRSGTMQTIDVGRSPHGIFLNTATVVAAR
jgi:YVTN family beta-propeller protein